MPQRFETGTAQAEFNDTVEEHYQQIYYEALEVVNEFCRKSEHQVNFLGKFLDNEIF